MIMHLSSFTLLCPPLPSPLSALIAVRAQLLVNQYTSALASVVTPGCCRPVLPETLGIVSSLVTSPMCNTQGHGPMVVLRCHDTTLARECYQKLKAVRDCLGLEYRFEMIFDDGQRKLTVSDHFRKRLSQHKCQSEHGLCYKDLHNLPCLVVLAGTGRASLSFPRCCTHMYTCRHTCTHTCTHMQTHVHTHTCTHMYTHAHTHVHTNTHMHTHMYTHMYTHADTCTHTHTHTHTNKYTHK